MRDSRVLVCLLGAVAVNSFGQSTVSSPTNAGPLPIVSIHAIDPIATWPGDPGVFTVCRSGNPAPALNVYYDIGGTATNGVDYLPIDHWVRIPAGVLSGDIVIQPINRGQSDTQTVVLTLTNSPLLTPNASAASVPINYIIGSPSTATVDITPGPATNVPPLVAIAYPPDGATFYTPINLPIVACARDLDGYVVSVEFFANDVSLGVVSNSISILPPTPSPVAATPPLPPYRPFVLVWTNAPPGTNVLLTAKATDNDGLSATSAPVSITVSPGPPPPPTNFPPVVRITSPANGAVFHAPVHLPIFAFAADKNGYVTRVEFFAGTNDLGPGHRVTSIPPPVPPSPILFLAPSNYWEFVWSNAPQGMYALATIATDDAGLSTVSHAVNITILPPVPPPFPTNIVNIVAVDPIAIAGTNCWPWLGLAGTQPGWSNWIAPASVWCSFTNCGPKDAIFAVRRFGGTNSDLIVNYAISGTASNGLNYVTLPGDVTIPAGQRVGLITVVPLEAAPSNVTTTVILTVTAGTNYAVGFPPRAAAIILDEPGPSAVSGVLPDQTFHLSCAGPDGAWFHVEYTSDLIQWTPICTNQVFYGAIDFVDPDAPDNQSRFYRAVPEAGPPD
jgi:hypothetical protein